MIRYKNVTNSVLRFRAFNEKGVKKVFELKPGKEIELGKEAKLGGLEKVGKNKKTKESGK